MAPDAPMISDLPDAIAHFDDLWRDLGGRTPAVFLDYDGTLTPIVEDPAAATLDDDARRVLTALADEVPVAIVSGRDLDDVRQLVDAPDFAYAGSHGFDMLLADGSSQQYGTEYLDDLDAAEPALRDRLGGIDGVAVERKRFAIAVHFRRADPADADRVGQVVRDVADDHPRLKITGGKAIHELRPDIEWDKGHAIRHLIDVLDIDEQRYAPIYVGDDLTDEDGYRAVTDTGLAVVVQGEENRPTIADYRLDDPAAAATLLDLMRERAATGTA